MISSRVRQALTGAAFLMATSAIGPGFITQTTVFTQKLAAAFGFAILLSMLLDIAVQMNVWRVISVAGKPAQEIANRMAPGLGYALSLLIVFGGLAFNIGNIAGAGLGLNVLFELDTRSGSILSCLFAIAVFLVKEATLAMDKIARSLGFLMIALTLYVAWKADPPLLLAAKETILPSTIDLTAILTIVGGTVGGYISFAGAHRLLDGGISGQASLGSVDRAAVTAISVASLMRVLLFLGALGVVVNGGAIAADNPAASVFRIAAGNIGYRLFGLVLWAAAITSVIGSAYTSVSFIRDFHPFTLRYQRAITICFIALSTLIFVFVGEPVKVLVLAGTLNGMILPVALTIMLLAAHQQKIIGAYKHPRWLTFFGILVIITMSYIAVRALILSSRSFF